MTVDDWDGDDEDEDDELLVLTRADIEAVAARTRAFLDLDVAQKLPLLNKELIAQKLQAIRDEQRSDEKANNVQDQTAEAVSKAVEDAAPKSSQAEAVRSEAELKAKDKEAVKKAVEEKAEVAPVLVHIDKLEAAPSEKIDMVAYLPKQIHGKTVLEKIGKRTWQATNTDLRGKPGGIAYRSSKQLWDKMQQISGPDWGEAVHGVDEGDGWVRVLQALGEQSVPKTANTADKHALAKQSSALAIIPSDVKRPRMRGSLVRVAQDQSLPRLVSVARTKSLVAHRATIRMRPSVERYGPLRRQRSRSRRRLPERRPASSSQIPPQAASQSPAKVEEMLSFFSWATDRRGNHVLVVDVNRLPPKALEGINGIQAAQIVAHGFSRDYVNRSGQWIDDASSTSSLRTDTLCLTYEIQGRQVHVGAIGGNTSRRPAALGLALCVAVAASSRQQEASLTTQLCWPHFAALVARVKHVEGEVQRDKEEISASRASRSSPRRFILRGDEEVLDASGHAQRRSPQTLQAQYEAAKSGRKQDRAAKGSRKRRRRSRSDSRRARR